MLLGAAGEHYVMCQFLRRGLIAALAPVGVPNADLIVTDDIGEKLCAIQVKTRVDKGSDGGWHMSKKHEDIVSENLLYGCVDCAGVTKMIARKSKAVVEYVKSDQFECRCHISNSRKPAF